MKVGHRNTGQAPPGSRWRESRPWIPFSRSSGGATKKYIVVCFFLQSDLNLGRFDKVCKPYRPQFCLMAYGPYCFYIALEALWETQKVSCMNPFVVGSGCCGRQKKMFTHKTFCYCCWWCLFWGASKDSRIKPFVIVVECCFGETAKVAYMKPFGVSGVCFEGHQRVSYIKLLIVESCIGDHQQFRECNIVIWVVVV